MKTLQSLLQRFIPVTSRPRRAIRRLQAQTLVEYALILAIISIVAIAMMIQLTGNVRTIYSNIDSQVARSQNGS